MIKLHVLVKYLHCFTLNMHKEIKAKTLNVAVTRIVEAIFQLSSPIYLALSFIDVFKFTLVKIFLFRGTYRADT